MRPKPAECAYSDPTRIDPFEHFCSMYGDLGRTYLLEVDFKAIDMMRVRLVKGAKEAEECRPEKAQI